MRAVVSEALPGAVAGDGAARCARPVAVTTRSTPSEVMAAIRTGERIGESSSQVVSVTMFGRSLESNLNDHMTAL
jgi:hypothetical protein